MWGLGNYIPADREHHTAVKKQLSKADIRAQMQREMELFEKDGGNVTRVPRGISGRDEMDNRPPQHTRSLFLEPSTKRTHIPEVIAAIEARRKKKPVHKAGTKTRIRAKSRQKTIYDDFGEPLRKVWVDD